MGRFTPAETFSLVARSVADVTAKNTCSGHNLPLLLLFRVIISQRDLAFPHGTSETMALVTYMTSTYQSLSIEDVAKALADAYRVQAKHMDVSRRVKVSVVSIAGRCFRALSAVGEVLSVPVGGAAKCSHKN